MDYWLVIWVPDDATGSMFLTDWLGIPKLSFTAARLKSAQPPKDTLMEFFEEKQRRWSQEDRLERSSALETLHKFQANDKEVVYLGTPERAKARRSDQRDSLKPDATASVYHSPHPLVVVLQDNEVTKYNIQSPQPSSKAATAKSLRTVPPYEFSPPISPSSSKIPMSSLMQVARTLLTEEKEDSSKTNMDQKVTKASLTDSIHDSESVVQTAPAYKSENTTSETPEVVPPIVKLQSSELATFTSFGMAALPSSCREECMKNEAAAESSMIKAPNNEIESTASDGHAVLFDFKSREKCSIKDNAGCVQSSVVKAPSHAFESFETFGMAVLPSKSREESSIKDQAPEPIADLESMTFVQKAMPSTQKNLDDVVLQTDKPPQRVQASTSEASSSLSQTMFLQSSTSQVEIPLAKKSAIVKYSEKGQGINKAPSYEMESFVTFGTAILPFRNVQSQEASEKQPVEGDISRLVMLQTTNSRDHMDDLPTFKPLARKVSEGSHIEIGTSFRTCDQRLEDDHDIIGPYDDVLRSFASFGVAILPTVSRSRDELDEDDDNKLVNGSSETEQTKPARSKLDIHALMENKDKGHKQTMPSETSEHDESPVAVDSTAIFRPLIFPTIQRRVEDTASKTSFQGSMALPISSQSSDPAEAKTISSTTHATEAGMSSLLENIGNDPKGPFEKQQGNEPAESFNADGNSMEDWKAISPTDSIIPSTDEEQVEGSAAPFMADGSWGTTTKAFPANCKTAEDVGASSAPTSAYTYNASTSAYTYNIMVGATNDTTEESAQVEGVHALSREGETADGYGLSSSSATTATFDMIVDTDEPGGNVLLKAINAESKAAVVIGALHVPTTADSSIFVDTSTNSAEGPDVVEEAIAFTVDNHEVNGSGAISISTDTAATEGTHSARGVEQKQADVRPRRNTPFNPDDRRELGFFSFFGVPSGYNYARYM